MSAKPNSISTIDYENEVCAQNYSPLPVVLSKGKGVHVWDESGKQYMDMMSAYSAVSHGHCHPELVKALCDQAATLGVVSRAYYSDVLGAFLHIACELTGFERALPMNSGAEAVETAMKAARKWGYRYKGIVDGEAEIIVCEGNFHGRTIAIVGMSTEPQYKDGFGPFPDGFKQVPYGDIEALKKAITPNTVAFLLEPVQGEGGIIVPPEGYLKACAELCKQRNVLLICDEIQCGLSRTGKFVASHHEGVQPDGLILGKALGGGVLPVSLFLANQSVMRVFRPGDHGSTFGGYPLAAAVGRVALEVMERDDYAGRAQSMGQYFIDELRKITSPYIKEVRGKGLLIGVEIHDPAGKVTAHDLCEQLLDRGILSKDTHETVIRFAPPLIITKEDIDWAVSEISAMFAALN